MDNDQRVLRAEVQARLDEHLDSVERALTDAGVSRSERHTICDEVEAQACEMVWQRAEGEPTEQDMRAVLAELDDPEAYREAADPSGPASTARATVAGPKVHPFALWALLLPAATVLLVFSPLRPQGEVSTFIFFGVVTFVSIVFATLAIRDIRREPDRYFGIALALFGALAIPLMMLNLVAFLQGEQMDPFGVRATISKQEDAKRIDRMEQILRQQHIERHGPNVPFELSSDLTLHRSRATLTASENWRAENLSMLPLLTHIAVVGLSATFSILLFVWLYRRCRPRSHTMATGQRADST